MYFSVKNWWSFKLFKFFYIYHVKNTDVADMTGLPNIGDIITKRRHTLFGHVVRLEATTPAHEALEQAVATKAGRCPGTNWRRPPGRPRRTWIQQVGEGTPASWRQMWADVAERGGMWTSRRVVARTTAVYASWWWWWWWWYNCSRYVYTALCVCSVTERLNTNTDTMDAGNTSIRLVAYHSL